MNINLGKLERIDIREVWGNEAVDFTPWLAENISWLSESLLMELTVEAVEQQVGLFRADILARNTATNELVLVENQLEQADHTHLGQIITYASGTLASIAIWVAAGFSSEHIAAINWLNSVAGEQFHVYAVEVALWKIGSSEYAPTLSVVAGGTELIGNKAPRGFTTKTKEVVINMNDAEVLEKYPYIDVWWISKGKKSVTLDEVVTVTGQSRKRVNKAPLRRSPRNPDLVLVSSVIEWLKRIPLPETASSTVKGESDTPAPEDTGPILHVVHS